MLSLIIKLWIICGLAWWPMLISIAWEKTKNDPKIIPEVMWIAKGVIIVTSLVISLLVWPTIIPDAIHAVKK